MTNLGELLRKLKLALYALVALLGFLLFIDLLQAYQVLFATSPWLARIYAFALVFAVAAIIFFTVRDHLAHPPVMLPPKRLGDGFVGGQLRLARYTKRYACALLSNPNIDEAAKTSLRQSITALGSQISIKAESENLANTQLLAQQAIDSALLQCDAIAERAVRNATRDVMITVTLSPWRALDFILVLWRNLRMVSTVIGAYNARPRMTELSRVYRDVFMVVITVDFLNFGSRLLQNLATSVPLLGRFADDIAQGVGAGLMTSVTGHSAIARSRAFREWNQSKESEKLGGRLTNFGRDISKLLFVDVWPKLKQPIDAKYSAGKDKPDSDEIEHNVEVALEETFSVMDSFVIHPSRAINSAASSGTEFVVSSTKWIGSTAQEYSAKVAKKIGKVASKAGQSIKAMFGRSKSN